MGLGWAWDPSFLACFMADQGFFRPFRAEIRGVPCSAEANEASFQALSARYTVAVSLKGFESSKLELRTATASSCQFTAEDWGSTYVNKLTGDKATEKRSRSC